jgi:hypothetical protein
VADPTTDTIRFTELDQLHGDVERALKRRYGRGIFVQEYAQTDDGSVVVELGTVVPRDRSDRSDDDRVLEFVEYESVFRLDGRADGDGYAIELASRDEVYEALQKRKRSKA